MSVGIVIADNDDHVARRHLVFVEQLTAVGACKNADEGQEAGSCNVQSRGGRFTKVGERAYLFPIGIGSQCDTTI